MQNEREASWIWSLNTGEAMEFSAQSNGFGAGRGRWHTLEDTSVNGSNGSASTKIRYSLNLERESKSRGSLWWQLGKVKGRVR